MDEEKIANPDDTNGAEEVETSEETTTEEETPNEDDALKKAEEKIIALKRELKEAKTSKESVKEPEIDNQTSNEPDYAKLAFLKAENVTHPDDQKIVTDEANRLKLPLTDVLQMEHIQSKLKAQKDEREVKSNTPKGNRRGSSKTQEDVDYWVNKEKKGGGYETPDDLELAEKVINARMKKQEMDNKFDPIRV
jgi:hypothetical protein